VITLETEPTEAGNRNRSTPEKQPNVKRLS